MEIKLDNKDVKNIIISRVKTQNPIENISLGIKMGNTLNVFKNNLADALAGNDLYILCPNNSTKPTNVDGDKRWSHDMSKYKIYKIDSEFLMINHINLDNLNKLGDPIKIKIDLLHEVYDSENGIVEEKIEELTLYQKVCLDLRLAKSGLVWLDELIKEHNKNN